MIPYFAYGTTQKGFTHYHRLAGLLGEPVARVRTVAPHAIVVPHRAACSNPGCEYVHRMAVLVPGFGPLHAEGDLFLVSTDALGVIDRLETGSADRTGPYVRGSVPVTALDGTQARTAQAYLARDRAGWQALVDHGHADPLTTYRRDLASGTQHKDCCIRAPGHAPPHDIVDPLRDVALTRLEAPTRRPPPAWRRGT